MALDDDIAAALPRSPPPAPARRTAAIEAAMRRFDGVDDPAPAHVERTAPWWTRLGRPQAGALVSVALVAIIGLPVAWISFNQPSDGGGSASRAPAAENQPMNLEDVAASNLADGAVAADAAAPALASNDVPARLDAQAPSAADAAPVELARIDAPPPAPAPAFAAPAPPPPPPATGMIAEKAEAPRESRAEPPTQLAARPRQDIVVTGTLMRQAPTAGAPLPRRADAAEMEDSNIVVTGAKRSTRASTRGDWNACTVDDPARSLGRCRALVDSSAKGANGRAAAQIADGLALAWKGEEAGAIAAFDRAIELAPRSASAYLNRGLVHRRTGDSDRAIADLDRAILYAPSAARGYYQRSLLRGERHQDRLARADARRAVRLDPRYADLFE